MVRIRLQRRGRRKKPFYHIVIADSRAPRDGRFIEKIGTYNPMTKPASIDIDPQLAFDWLLKGAQPSDTVRAILRVKGVMFRKHLHRGVLKGALTQEEADVKYKEYVDKKESSFADRAAETAKEKEAIRRTIAGKKPVIKAPEPEIDYTIVAPDEPEADAATAPEASKTADQSVTQDAPAVETPAEPVSEAKVEEVVAEAKSPAATEAEGEAQASTPDQQAAVDKAVDAAEETKEA